MIYRSSFFFFSPETNNEITNMSICTHTRIDSPTVVNECRHVLLLMHRKVKVEMITDDFVKILQFEVNVQYCSVV